MCRRAEPVPSSATPTTRSPESTFALRKTDAMWARDL